MQSKISLIKYVILLHSKPKKRKFLKLWNKNGKNKQKWTQNLMRMIKIINLVLMLNNMIIIEKPYSIFSIPSYNQVKIILNLKYLLILI